MAERTCKGCGGAMPPTRPAQARHCSDQCKSRTQGQRWAGENTERSREIKRESWRKRSGTYPASGDRYAAARAAGYRSGLEEVNCDRLTALGVSFEYETLVIPYTQPVKPRRYTPDFILPNGIIIETKGRFVTADRQKHLLIQEQYPDLDVRFVFSNPNTRISKQSQTTYARWCEAKGFKYAKLHIPLEWIKEPLNERSILAMTALRREATKGKR